MAHSCLTLHYVPPSLWILVSHPLAPRLFKWLERIGFPDQPGFQHLSLHEWAHLSEAKTLAKAELSGHHHLLILLQRMTVSNDGQSECRHHAKACLIGV
jgi:hypothetical protein